MSIIAGVPFHRNKTLRPPPVTNVQVKVQELVESPPHQVSLAPLLGLAVQDDAGDRDTVAQHPHDRHGVPEDEDGDDHRDGAFRVPKNLQGQRSEGGGHQHHTMTQMAAAGGGGAGGGRQHRLAVQPSEHAVSLNNKKIHLERERAGVLGDEEVGEVDEVGEAGVAEQDPEEARVHPGEVRHHPERVALHGQRRRHQQQDGHRRHVAEEVHGVHLLPARGAAVSECCSS